MLSSPHNRPCISREIRYQDKGTIPCRLDSCFYMLRSGNQAAGLRLEKGIHSDSPVRRSWGIPSSLLCFRPVSPNRNANSGLRCLLHRKQDPTSPEPPCSPAQDHPQVCMLPHPGSSHPDRRSFFSQISTMYFSTFVNMKRTFCAAFIVLLFAARVNTIY